MQSPDAGLAVA